MCPQQHADGLHVAGASGHVKRRFSLQVDGLQQQLLARTLLRPAQQLRNHAHVPAARCHVEGRQAVGVLGSQPLFAAGKFGEIPRQSLGMICVCVAFVALAIAGARFVGDDVVWRACDALDARKRQYAAAHASAADGLDDAMNVSLRETVPVPVTTITSDD